MVCPNKLKKGSSCCMIFCNVYSALRHLVLFVFVCKVSTSSWRTFLPKQCLAFKSIFDIYLFQNFCMNCCLMFLYCVIDLLSVFVNKRH